MAKKTGEGHWVTINGTHVLIDGDSKIIQGPKHMIGMTPRQAVGIDPVPESKTTKKSTSTKKTKKDSTKSIKNASYGYATTNNSELNDAQLKKKKKLIEKERDEVLNEVSKYNGSSYEIKKLKEGYNKALKDIDDEIGNRSSSKSKSTKSGSKSEGTFTVDGVKYTLKQTPEGGQITYQDDGFTVLHGFNSSYKDINTAKKSVIDTNKRIAKSKKADEIAKETGGVALYTGKVIKNGSVTKSGVSKDGLVQYTAVDAKTGKTIKLDSSDMGALYVAAYDSMIDKAISSSRSSNKGITTKTTTKKSSGTKVADVNGLTEHKKKSKAINSARANTGSSLFDNATSITKKKTRGK